MATYYKYEKADDISKSMIDWSGLTKTISDNLMTEKARRDELKKQHDIDNAKQLNEVSKFEQGLDPTLNAKMLEYSQSYRQYLLENHKLMKSGLITVNDAMLIKQNATDSWANMNLATKTFNTKIQEVLDKGGNVNDFIAKQAINIFDLKNKKLFINDQGTASVGNIKEDGSIDKNTLVPWTKLNEVTAKKYDRFDMTSEVSKAVSTAGVYTIAPSSTRTISDVKLMPGYDKWLSNSVKEILNSDDKIVTAAADALGMSPTTDAELVKSNPEEYFLVEMVNGIPKFDVDSIKGKVEEAVKSKIEMSLGRKETKTEASAFSQQRGMQIKDQRDAGQLLANYLATGSQESASALVNAIPNISGIDTTGGVIRFIDAKGNMSAPVSNKGNFSEAFKGLAGVAGIEANIISDLANTYKGRSMSSDFKAVVGTTSAPLSVSSDIIKEIDKAFGYVTDEKSKEGGTGIGQMQGGMPSDNTIQAKVALAAQSIGLDPNKVTVSGGKPKYEDKDLGSNGASISSALNSIKQGGNTNQAPI